MRINFHKKGANGFEAKKAMNYELEAMTIEEKKEKKI